MSSVGNIILASSLLQLPIMDMRCRILFVRYVFIGFEEVYNMHLYPVPLTRPCQHTHTTPIVYPENTCHFTLPLIT